VIGQGDYSAQQEPNKPSISTAISTLKKISCNSTPVGANCKKQRGTF
jgi:hypothetical protein